jgi:SAM-dependent methyltransferase
MIALRVIRPNRSIREYVKQLAPTSALNTRIHRHDQMLLFKGRDSKQKRDFAARSYFQIGSDIADFVRQLVQWKFGGFQNINKFLDFASGYGRVTRFLVQHIDPSRLWVSDILAEAVKFQKTNLGVHGFVSASDPDQLDVADRFDCILVCSLFSHLPEATFVKWLEKLYGLLAPSGLLIISTLDEFLLGVPPSVGPLFRFERVSEIKTLDKDEYGLTTVNEHYVRGAIRQATRGTGTYFRIPRGLNRQQDVYLITAQPQPDFTTLHGSLGPLGCVQSISLVGPELLEVNGWAFDPGRPKVEVRVVVQGELIQTCQPEEPRADVARHFENPNAERSGFRCVGQLPGNADSLRAAYLDVFAVGSSGESFRMFNGRLGEALGKK